MEKELYIRNIEDKLETHIFDIIIVEKETWIKIKNYLLNNGYIIKGIDKTFPCLINIYFYHKIIVISRAKINIKKYNQAGYFKKSFNEIMKAIKAMRNKNFKEKNICH